MRHRHKVAQSAKHTHEAPIDAIRQVLLMDIVKHLKKHSLKGLPYVRFRTGTVGYDVMRNMLTTIAEVFVVKSSRIASRKYKIRTFRICR